MKDSVVGEERIAQYLLAILNTRSTPLHWKNLMRERTDKLVGGSGDKNDFNVKDLLPKRKRPLDQSDVHYIEVTSQIFFFGLIALGECGCVCRFLLIFSLFSFHVSWEWIMIELFTTALLSSSLIFCTVKSFRIENNFIFFSIIFELLTSVRCWLGMITLCLCIYIKIL